MVLGLKPPLRIFLKSKALRPAGFKQLLIAFLLARSVSTAPNILNPFEKITHTDLFLGFFEIIEMLHFSKGVNIKGDYQPHYGVLNQSKHHILERSV